MMKLKLSILFFVFLFIKWSNGNVLENSKHDLQIVNNENFNVIVNRFRNEKIFFILFFKNSHKNIKKVITQYSEIATKLKGIVTFCSIDCDVNAKLCDSELSLTVPEFQNNNTHSLLVYPILPMPKFVFSEELTEANVKKYLYLIPSKIEIIKDENDFNVFISKHENVPKVLIFSNKKKPNYILNALSTSFQKKLLFCFINIEIEPLIKKYNVTTFPQISIYKKNKIEDTYKGKLVYLDLFDWINVHAETFVFGGGYDTSPDKTDEKPWKFELVPKLTKLSYGDICFKKADKGLCLIYLKEGDKLEKEEINMLIALKEKFKPHIDGRGVQFRFMWIDIKAEKNFRNLFEMERYPSVVVFNPYKRIRFAKLNTDLIATQENIEKLLEKIAGGDAKFTMLKDQKLPEFIEDPKTNGKSDVKDEL